MLFRRVFSVFCRVVTNVAESGPTQQRFALPPIRGAKVAGKVARTVPVSVPRQPKISEHGSQIAALQRPVQTEHMGGMVGKIQLVGVESGHCDFDVLTVLLPGK